MFGLTRDFDVSLLVSVTETLQSRFLPVNIPFVSGSHGEAFLRGCDDERGGKSQKKEKKNIEFSFLSIYLIQSRRLFLRGDKVRVHVLDFHFR